MLYVYREKKKRNNQLSITSDDNFRSMQNLQCMILRNFFAKKKKMVGLPAFRYLGIWLIYVMMAFLAPIRKTGWQSHILKMIRFDTCACDSPKNTVLQPWLHEIMHDTCLAEKGIFGRGTVSSNTAAQVCSRLILDDALRLSQAGYIPVCDQLHCLQTFECMSGGGGGKTTAITTITTTTLGI